MGEVLMSVNGVRKEFFRKGRESARYFDAVHDASFELAAGDIVACRGRSGSGKTTLLNIMGGLLLPTEGTVELQGQDLYALDDVQRSKLRNEAIGVVPQGQTALGSLTLLQNVVLPFGMYRPHQPVEERAMALLERLGIAGLADSYPAALSGGEMRRMAVARALVCRPRVLLADEPTGDLDDESTADVLEVLKTAAGEGMAVFMVTHDDQAAAAATRTMHMNAGELAVAAKGGLVGERVQEGACARGQAERE